MATGCSGARLMYLAGLLGATWACGQTVSDSGSWIQQLRSGTAAYNEARSAEAVRELEEALAGAKRGHASDMEQAGVLDSLGAAYESAGRLGEALAAFNQALATRQKFSTAPNEALATSLINESTIYWTMANADKSVAYAEQAKAMWEELKQTDRREYAIVVNDLLAAYRLQGHIRQSLPLMNFAQDLYSRILSKTDPTLAQSLSSLASSYKEAGDYATADRLSRQALDLLDANQNTGGQNSANRDGGGSPALRLHLLAALAELELAEDRLPQAQQHVQESLRLSTENSSSVSRLQLANEYRTLGTIFRIQGRAVQAEEQYRLALKTLEAGEGQAAVERAAIDNDLALLAEHQRDWKAVLPLLTAAQKTLAAAFGPDHPALANTYSNLAGYYEYRHQYAKAEKLYRQALAIDMAALPRVHPVVGRDLNNLASLAFKAHHYKEAEPLFRDALNVFVKSVGATHPSTGLTQANLANVLYRLKENEEARQCFRAAAATLEHSWGVDDPRLVDILSSYAQFSRQTADMAAAEEIETHLLRIQVKQAIARERAKTTS